jgi:hypothetical protein
VYRRTSYRPSRMEHIAQITYFSPLCTRVRGIRILRTSPFGHSRKFTCRILHEFWSTNEKYPVSPPDSPGPLAPPPSQAGRDSYGPGPFVSADTKTVFTVCADGKTSTLESLSPMVSAWAQVGVGMKAQRTAPEERLHQCCSYLLPVAGPG